MRRKARRGILASVMCLVISAAVSAEEVVETWPDGTRKSQHVVDDNGVRNGASVTYYESGKVHVEAVWLDGKLHGAQSTYAEDGRLTSVIHFAHGDFHGEHKTFGQKGSLLARKGYRNGVLHGTYATWSADRKPELKAKYKHGLLHGRYESFDHAGKLTVRAKYKEGELHGTYVAFENGRRVSKQTWSGGQVVDVDGVVPFPRRQTEVNDLLTELLTTGTPIPADPLEADRARALRVLMGYRSLVGVPYKGMSLDPGYNALAQAAAEICDGLGGLTHTPKNPGWPADKYQLAAKGAGSCNLGYGSAEASISGYMDDSDKSNIDALGHRSWCVFPNLKKTGFGRGGKTTAMYALDRSGSAGSGDLVMYPPAGHVPQQWFGPRHAWSIWVRNGYDPPQPSAVKVVIEPVGADFLPIGAPLGLDHMRVSAAHYGIQHRIAFRPAALDISEGKQYRVTVSGLELRGKPTTLRYYVAFFRAAHGPRVPRARR